MKILLVMGQLAKETVEKYARKAVEDVEVLALSTPVAALLTISQIAGEVSKMKIKGFGMILVPGLVKGDTSPIEKSSGIPTFKGPRYVADLPLVLEQIEHVKLSKTIPACEVLRSELTQRTLNELENVERDRESLLRRSGNILISDLAVGRDFPMRVMAEILDAPLLSNSEIREKAEYFKDCGAQIIDIGMVAGKSRPRDAERTVKLVKRSLNIPVSIDTFDMAEAKAAVSAGADLLLSVDAGTIEEAAEFASDIVVVITPTDQRKGYFPKSSSERVKLLEENVRKASKLGMKKIIGDLILDPVNIPGIVESLTAYRLFSTRNPQVPIMFGVGNVTELMDADSIGVNALLAGMASELGVSLLLTTEGSDKTKGSVRELAMASKMMLLAKKRSSVPKDLGLDLLILKDKRLRDEAYDETGEEGATIVNARETGGDELDSKGMFKISIDRKEKLLIATHFLGDVKREVIKGRNAKGVYSTIIGMNLISSLSHAAYLGRELEKAETTLRIGKTYIQDEPLFT